ncbi:hypothetical protein BRC82_02395 [Halobacteriales archaeon QS_1_67_19]|nr:MAG: hypothetical protein BRC82_02395 [Halobacteriales archaeon QS_1_67_19]
MSIQGTEHRIGFPEEVANETVEYGSEDTSLEDAARDLRTAHEEIEQYRKGALALTAELEELQAMAEAEGNNELARTARQLKQSAIAVTERIEQG